MEERKGDSGTLSFKKEWPKGRRDVREEVRK